MNTRTRRIAAGAAIVVGIAAIIFLGYSARAYRNQTLSLRADVSVLETERTELSQDLATASSTLASLTSEFALEKARNSSFVNQVKDLSSSVTTLTKLTQTDSQLLQKYSRVYFLNENYVPAELTDIDASYVYPKGKGEEIESHVAPRLQALLTDAASSSAPLLVISAYRSFGTQAALKAAYKVTYGLGANQFSADQGYSEHQLGTTVDFTTSSVGATFLGFDKTPQYAWLIANAYRYGFILSYPPNNSFYQYEPWHWRYVGVALATKLHDSNQYFYTLDQREINTYLGSIFD